FGLYLVCQLFGSVIALIFISPVVLAPLGAAGLIFNVVFSRIFLGTRITGYDWAGTVLIVLGCAIVSLFASQGPDDNQKIDDLMRLFMRPTFIIFFTLQGLVVLCMFIFIKYLEYGIGSFRGWAESAAGSAGVAVRNSRRRREENTPLLRGTDVLRESGDVGVVHAASAKERDRRHAEIIGILYALLGGLSASETLLLAKSGVGLLITSVVGSVNQFNGGFSLMILLVLVLTLFLQLYCLNRGLHYALPVLVVPLFYTTYTCFSLVNSIIYFDQTSVYDTPELVAIGLGVGIIVAGVWLLRFSQGAGDGREELPRVGSVKEEVGEGTLGRVSVYTNGDEDVDRLLETAEAMMVDGEGVGGSSRG
ncbi:hypothetical protein HDV00_002919, partial [Rhizophlyctis rosea]